jgi:hypothetical protein
MQNRSWKPDSRSVDQETPRRSRNLKAHNRVHKIPSLNYILSQMNLALPHYNLSLF